MGRRRRIAVVVFMLLSSCPWASALSPDLDINQYAHTAWSSRDGFLKGSVTSIAQTPDGYLWLGTEYGLLRFDGVRSVPWQPPSGQPLPNISVRSLLVSRNGTLWIGTLNGLASWKDGTLTRYPQVPAHEVDALLEDRGGTVWAGVEVTPAWILCAVQGGSTRCYGEDGGIGLGVGSLFEDRSGNLWAGTQTGLWRWRPGRPEVFPLSPATREIHALIEGESGAPLIATRGGIIQLVDGKAEAHPLPGTRRQVNPFSLLRDRNGGLWIGTRDRGLLHLHQGRTDVFSQSDGLSGDRITALFEDREGSIWVGTVNGLDRFRDFAVARISVKQGLSTASVESVLAARDGSMWLGTRDGLHRWSGGRITIYNTRTDRGLPDDHIGSLFQDDDGRLWLSTPRGAASFEDGRFVPAGPEAGGFVHAIAEDGIRDLWMSADQGLLRLRRGRVIEQIPWPKLGRQGVALALVADPQQGGLWLGFGQGGVAYLKDGQVRETYAAVDGLGEGSVADLKLDPDGALWAATAGGLSRLKGGRAFTLTKENGLPCNTVHWVVEGSDHSFYMHTACGLVRTTRAELDLWISNPQWTIRAAVFDNADGVGLHSKPITAFSPRAAWSTDARLWFLSGDGVSVVDPRHVPVNTLPPPVHIEEIIADRQIHETSSHVRLAPRVRNLEIHYTALSLVAPEKNRFKVKLEGWDRDWQDVGGRREAFYTDLAPGSYRFRAIAANNSGVWNEEGAVLDFTIEPAYYQTTWFRALAAAALVGLLFSAYRVRVRVVERHSAEITAFNERLMKAQEQERTRIAGELHDSIMQQISALSLVLGTAKRKMQADSEARDMVVEVQRKLIDVGSEVRQLSHDLYPPMLKEAGLAEVLRGYCDAFGQSRGIPVSCEVDESVADLSPGTALALYRVAQEALGNAAKHAAPTRVDVRLLRIGGEVVLSVADDGQGCELGRAADGGLGLVNMRQRARQLGGTFDLDSRPGRGTTVRVAVPFRIREAKPPEQA